MSDVHVLVLPSWYPTPAAPVAGIFIREQALALRKAGVRVGVIYPDLRTLRTLPRGKWGANHFQMTRSDEEGVTVLRYHGWGLPKLPRWTSRLWISSALALAERYMVEAGRPRLVHAHATCWAGIAGVAIAERFDLPYVLTEHSSAFAYRQVEGWRRPLAMRALGYARRILAVSPALADAVRPYAGERPIEIVPNVVDTAFFALPPAPRPSEPFRFLTVGLLTPKKGIDLLVQAFAAGFQSRPDVILEIAGDGPERAALGRLAQQLGVADRVAFLGLLDRAGVRAAMWRANCYVLASTKETFGVALIEAMATGLPVIATRSGGPDGLVAPELGRLVPPACVDTLADAMISCRNEGPRTAAQERASHSHVAARFGPEPFAAQVVQIYREVVDETLAGAPNQGAESQTAA
jgi:glycosyltransferase involved in cell wall biosynthesis